MEPKNKFKKGKEKNNTITPPIYKKKLKNQTTAELTDWFLGIVQIQVINILVKGGGVGLTKFSTFP